MNTNNSISTDIVISTTTTKISTSPDGSQTVSTDATNNDQLRNVLNYAIPFSVFTIFLFIAFVLALRHRHRISDKWHSLKKMKNTNPKFLQDTGLRRDSEYESYNHDHIKSPLDSLENPVNTERQYRLSTIN
ncbi:unnamed protein product [Rotaria magnacalcarata]|uniref:Uncharacterized protein n=2 Tax=Rotaria magnacalcarata TaxID=392030 RepID=A0A819LT81_9BILA|nr:unnamed protein product [Rotaria magnacalcarata]CAF1940060.1 unnamed protein product [Rotaria magnacalcarata]CAF2067782.1 unnamed protein product [Rotaria magnacalcarata]CAF3845673.1 unnamed protein product [Rotaria magnacalcarata]CAF3965847.1 unnamed protein product [Rotaria magnacalcarata]